MMPAEAIVALLVAANVGVLAPATPWPIFEGKFPDEVAQCILVRETGGRTPEVRIAINYPTVQILVRSTRNGFVASRQKVEDVFQALQAIPSGPAVWPELTSCIAVGGITFVGYDTEERPVWSVNFNLIVSNAPQGYRDL